MARQRRQARTAATAGAGATSGDFTCPECGKTFSRAASLGAHRQRAHGVAGASKKTASRRSKRQQSPASSRSSRRPTTRRATAGVGASQQKRDGQGVVDRDQLLQTLFPNGVPPQEAVIKRLSGWLDEAERLANL